MKTQRYSDMIRVAAEPKNVAAAKDALVEAEAQLAALRGKMKALPDNLSPEARAVVADVIEASRGRSVLGNEMRQAVAHLSTEELRISAEEALGTFEAYKITEPLLVSKVEDRRERAEGLEKLHALSNQAPFLAKTAAWLLDRLDAAST